MGYHPVAVVILHVHKYEKKVTRKFKSGGLHERHVVVTWKPSEHSLVDTGKPIQFNSIYFVFDRSKGVVSPQDIEHVNI